MSFTYNMPVETDIDKVRLRIFDTDKCDYILQDEEIESYLDMFGSVPMAIVHICYSLAMRFANSSYEELEVDDIRIKEGKDKSQMYLDLAKAIQDLIDSGMELDYIPNYEFGGVYQAELDSNKQAQIDGTIKVNPFQTGVFDTF